MFYIYKNTDYIVTNNRLIIKTGFISVKTRSIYYDEIKSTFADKGLIDKVFGTGTILINANRIIKHDKKKYSRTINGRFRLINFEAYIDFVEDVEKSLQKNHYI